MMEYKGYVAAVEYLKWCEEDGVEPKRPFSGKLNLRLGSELHALVAAAAIANRMSINSWIVRSLRSSIGVKPPDSVVDTNQT